MTNKPFMRLWVNDFAGDTLGLTDRECGQYMFLLMAMWNSGGSLPNDPVLIRQISRARLKVSERVLGFFTQEDDRLTQKRLQQEIRYVTEKSLRNSAAGKSSASARALKRLNGHSTNVEKNVNQNSTILEPDIIKKEKKETRARGALPGFDKFWEAFPNKVGKGTAIKSWAGAIKKTTPEEILAGVERYKSSKPADRAWCNPSTFLNGERWLDQPNEIVPAYTPKPVNGFKPTMVLNSYQTFAPAEKFIPPTPEEIARRDAAIKAMRSAVKRA